MHHKEEALAVLVTVIGGIVVLAEATVAEVRHAALLDYLDLARLHTVTRWQVGVAVRMSGSILIESYL